MSSKVHWIQGSLSTGSSGVYSIPEIVNQLYETQIFAAKKGRNGEYHIHYDPDTNLACFTLKKADQKISEPPYWYKPNQPLIPNQSNPNVVGYLSHSVISPEWLDPKKITKQLVELKTAYGQEYVYAPNLAILHNRPFDNTLFLSFFIKHYTLMTPDRYEEGVYYANSSSGELVKSRYHITPTESSGWVCHDEELGLGEPIEEIIPLVKVTPPPVKFPTIAWQKVSTLSTQGASYHTTVKNLRKRMLDAIRNGTSPCFLVSYTDNGEASISTGSPTTSEQPPIWYTPNYPVTSRGPMASYVEYATKAALDPRWVDRKRIDEILSQTKKGNEWDNIHAYVLPHILLHQVPFDETLFHKLFVPLKDLHHCTLDQQGIMILGPSATSPLYYEFNKADRRITAILNTNSLFFVTPSEENDLSKKTMPNSDYAVYNMHMPQTNEEIARLLEQLRATHEENMSSSSAPLEKNTQEPMYEQAEQKPRWTRIKGKLKKSGSDAAWRTASRQLTKTGVSSLRAGVSHLNLAPETQKSVETFMGTPWANALVAQALSLMLETLPGKYGEKAERLAEELRTESLAIAMDQVGDIVMDPLREMLTQTLEKLPDVPKELPQKETVRPHVKAHDIGIKIKPKVRF